MSPLSPCVPCVPLYPLCPLYPFVSLVSPVSPVSPCVLLCPLCPLVSPVSPCVPLCPLCPLVSPCVPCVPSVSYVPLCPLCPLVSPVSLVSSVASLVALEEVGAQVQISRRGYFQCFFFVFSIFFPSSYCYPLACFHLFLQLNNNGQSFSPTHGRCLAYRQTRVSIRK